MRPARACSTCGVELLEAGDRLHCPRGHEVRGWLVIDLESSQVLARAFRNRVLLGAELAAFARRFDRDPRRNEGLPLC